LFHSLAATTYTEIFIAIETLQMPVLLPILVVIVAAAIIAVAVITITKSLVLVVCFLHSAPYYDDGIYLYLLTLKYFFDVQYHDSNRG
jgi:hypothetical protein